MRRGEPFPKCIIPVMIRGHLFQNPDITNQKAWIVLLEFLGATLAILGIAIALTFKTLYAVFIILIAFPFIVAAFVFNLFRLLKKWFQRK